MLGKVKKVFNKIVEKVKKHWKKIACGAAVATIAAIGVVCVRRWFDNYIGEAVLFGYDEGYTDGQASCDYFNPAELVMATTRDEVVGFVDRVNNILNEIPADVDTKDLVIYDLKKQLYAGMNETCFSYGALLDFTVVDIENDEVDWYKVTALESKPEEVV